MRCIVKENNIFKSKNIFLVSKFWILNPFSTHSKIIIWAKKAQVNRHHRWKKLGCEVHRPNVPHLPLTPSAATAFKWFHICLYSARHHMGVDKKRCRKIMLMLWITDRLQRQFCFSDKFNVWVISGTDVRERTSIFRVSNALTMLIIWRTYLMVSFRFNNVEVSGLTLTIWNPLPSEIAPQPKRVSEGSIFVCGFLCR